MKRTVQDVISTIIAAIPGAPYHDTVDTLKTGDPQQKVTAVAVTFMATYEVIEHTIQAGANLIITHEPTFYSHRDETAWLEGDPVYQAKRRLIDDNHIAIWRFHDYLHSIDPDPTTTGLLKALGWAEYAVPGKPNTCRLPTRTLGELVDGIKASLGLQTVQVVGDLQMSCSKVGISVGAIGGRVHIEAISSEALDVLVCGEINEWETSEYARDAVSTGHPRALVVTGHSASEEDGMREVLPWLQERLPGLPFHFIATGPALRMG